MSSGGLGKVVKVIKEKKLIQNTLYLVSTTNRLAEF